MRVPGEKGTSILTACPSSFATLQELSESTCTERHYVYTGRVAKSFLEHQKTVWVEFIDEKGLPADCTLREVLLADKDEMPVDEFLYKIPLWLALFRQVKA